MKKYSIYIIVLIIGLLLGSQFLGNTASKENTAQEHKHTGEKNEMWTCSMHPQIMKSEPGDCPICGMDLIPAVTSEEGLEADQFKLSENAIALANIQTTVIGKDMSKGATAIFLSGKISNNEDALATQPAHFDGRIEKLYVNSVGEYVKMKQAVAEIYSPDLVVAQQELLTAYKNRKLQAKIYKAVRAKFKNWKIPDSQVSEIEKTGKTRQKFKIYSHVSGVVSEIKVSKGAHIMDGHAIFKVVNLNTVWADFDVYENQISQFKKGQKIKIKTKAYPAKKFDATVTFIDPVLNATTRTVIVRAIIKNKEKLFKPGMFVEGEIQSLKENSKEVLMIPASSVLWTGKRSVVYVKVNATASVFEMHEISIGAKKGKFYEVLKGLKVGDEIVTNGTFTVDAAAQLQGKKSMMNRQGKKPMMGHNHSGMEMVSSDEKQNVSKTEERIKVGVKFQKQLKKVFENYITLKDALVKEDFLSVQKASEKGLESLANVDMKLLGTNQVHMRWMGLEKNIRVYLNSIAKASDVKGQRTAFKPLSKVFIEAIQVFGINEKVYSQFCPMADKNKGGYWLSKENNVVNPYFGDAMLNCGSVNKIIE